MCCCIKKEAMAIVNGNQLLNSGRSGVSDNLVNYYTLFLRVHEGNRNESVVGQSKIFFIHHWQILKRIT